MRHVFRGGFLEEEALCHQGQSQPWSSSWLPPVQHRCRVLH